MNSAFSSVNPTFDSRGSNFDLAGLNLSTGASLDFSYVSVSASVIAPGTYQFLPEYADYGSYTLNNFADIFIAQPGYFATQLGAGQVTITQISAAPEPTTWLLMFLGIGAVGGALRMRRREFNSVATA